VIGFLLCAKEGPPVNFLTPKNPIEKLEGATKAGREIRFYNSEVSSFFSYIGIVVPIYDSTYPAFLS
jgi:hypothetical protein